MRRCFIFDFQVKQYNIQWFVILITSYKPVDLIVLGIDLTHLWFCSCIIGGIAPIFMVSCIKIARKNDGTSSYQALYQVQEM